MGLAIEWQVTWALDRGSGMGVEGKRGHSSSIGPGMTGCSSGLRPGCRCSSSTSEDSEGSC